MKQQYLIVGASRGIGLGLVEALGADGQTVIATSRDGKGYSPRARWLQLDVIDSESRRLLSKAPPLAGTTHIVVSTGVMPKDVDDTLTTQVVADVFYTNSVAPIALADLLIRQLSPRYQRIMFLGSRMGSVTLNDEGDQWVYRASKAALTSAAKSFFNRHRKDGIDVTVVHPGWVRTDMGGAQAEIDIQTSVRGLVALLAEPPSPEGFRYCDYLGRALPY